jgi:hypothetical protein
MRRLVLLSVLVLSLAACGGSGGGGGNVAAGPAGDPVGAVNNVINAIKAKAMDKLGPLFCSAKRDALVASAGGGAPSDLVAAMTFDFKDLKVEQKSINGDNAVVHVGGKMSATIDQAKGKDAVRKMLQAAAPSGTQVTDAQVDQAMTTFGQINEIPLDTDLDVVKENGGWLVCTSISG